MKPYETPMKPYEKWLFSIPHGAGCLPSTVGGRINMNCIVRPRLVFIISIMDIWQTHNVLRSQKCLGTLYEISLNFQQIIAHRCDAGKTHRFLRHHSNHHAQQKQHSAMIAGIATNLVTDELMYKKNLVIRMGLV